MKRLLAGAILFLGLATIGVIWLRSQRAGTDSEARQPFKNEEDYRTVKAESPAFDSTVRSQEEESLKDRDRVDEVRRIIEASNVAIRFWGKVVDQDGSPLADVVIAYTYFIEHGNDLGVAWIDEETRSGSTKTDVDGSFAIIGLTGHHLAIESLSKAGFLYRMRSSPIYNFAGDTSQGKFETRRDRPIVFAMVHESGMEELVHAKGRLNVSGDGSPERWNLWTGEADPTGELTVTFKRDPAVLKWPGRLATWSANLEIVGGGIIEAPWDEDVRRAPESGYVQTTAYPEMEQKQGVPHRSFYLKTADGKFGRIEVELYQSDEGATARCYITGDMNPRAGSRNLEPAEEQ